MNSWIPKSDKSLNKPIRTRDRKESLKRRNSKNKNLPISWKNALDHTPEGSILVSGIVGR